MFAVRVSLGGPTTALPDAPPASDNAPATPNTVTAFVRPFRFEFRLRCDTVKASQFHPRAQQHINRPIRRLPLRQLGDVGGDPPRLSRVSSLVANGGPAVACRAHLTSPH